MRSKEYYRDCVKKAFSLLSQEEKKERSSKLVQKLLLEASFQQAKTVMAYLSLKDEVNIQPVFKAKKKFYIPKIKNGLVVPVELFGNEIVDLDDLDLVIVPGRAFTKQGVRIGRGLGFYDRFLATLPANIFTVSLAFSFQMFGELPVEKHDVMIGKIIIEA